MACSVSCRSSFETHPALLAMESLQLGVLVILFICFTFVTTSPLGNPNWVVQRQAIDTDDKPVLKSESQVTF